MAQHAFSFLFPSVFAIIQYLCLYFVVMYFVRSVVAVEKLRLFNLQYELGPCYKIGAGIGTGGETPCNSLHGQTTDTSYVVHIIRSNTGE